MLQITNPELFAQVVEEAKRRTLGDTRWCSAIDRAVEEMTADPTFFHWMGTHLLIQSPTSSEVYEASDTSCACEAFTFRKPCKHRAAYRLWRNYLRAVEAADWERRRAASRVNTEESAVLVGSRPKNAERVRGFQI